MVSQKQLEGFQDLENAFKFDLNGSAQVLSLRPHDRALARASKAIVPRAGTTIRETQRSGAAESPTGVRTAPFSTGCGTKKVNKTWISKGTPVWFHDFNFPMNRL